MALELTNKEIKLYLERITGNKLDLTRFKVDDIYKTSTDPVAKVMRKISVATSEKIIGSISFVPSVAGLILASEVVKDLIRGG